MPHPSDPTIMTDVISDHHLFTIAGVTAEYESRQVEPAPVLVAAVETLESIQDRFRTYDAYEKLDVAFSRLVVEALVSPDFRDTVKHRFSHVVNFESLPGQIYFMMILDACNASVITDVKAAQESFRALSLNDFPGENITDLTAKALKHIKVMRSAYSLPQDLGSVLLEKCSKTESSIANQAFINRYINTTAFEDLFGLGDPTLQAAHPDYSKFGPYGTIAFMTETYGNLLKSNNWPALNSTPAGHYTPAPAPTPTPTSVSTPKSSFNGGAAPDSNSDTVVCFNCGKSLSQGLSSSQASS